jgi:hypothetical protein
MTPALSLRERVARNRRFHQPGRVRGPKIRGRIYETAYVSKNHLLGLTSKGGAHNGRSDGAEHRSAIHPYRASQSTGHHFEPEPLQSTASTLARSRTFAVRQPAQRGSAVLSVPEAARPARFGSKNAWAFRLSSPNQLGSVPVLTCTQLEQAIPFADVLRVERTPTVPSLGRPVTVLVMAIGGFVIGCDTEKRVWMVSKSVPWGSA